MGAAKVFRNFEAMSNAPAPKEKAKKSAKFDAKTPGKRCVMLR